MWSLVYAKVACGVHHKSPPILAGDNLTEATYWRTCTPLKFTGLHATLTLRGTCVRSWVLRHSLIDVLRELCDLE